jgi:hypothetical protein
LNNAKLATEAKQILMQTGMKESLDFLLSHFMPEHQELPSVILFKE